MSEFGTWEEWAAALGDNILDPDGFRDLPREHLYTFAEYEDRVSLCTMGSL